MHIEGLLRLPQQSMHHTLLFSLISCCILLDCQKMANSNTAARAAPIPITATRLSPSKGFSKSNMLMFTPIMPTAMRTRIMTKVFMCENFKINQLHYLQITLLQWPTKLRQILFVSQPNLIFLTIFLFLSKTLTLYIQ